MNICSIMLNTSGPITWLWTFKKTVLFYYLEQYALFLNFIVYVIENRLNCIKKYIYFLFTTNYKLLVSLVYLIFYLIEIIQKCRGSQFILLLGKTESDNNKQFPTFLINIHLGLGQLDNNNQILTLLAKKLSGFTA